MKDKNYKKAFTEVRAILKNTEENLVSKIPKSFEHFLEENYDKEYQIPPFDFKKSLDEQELLEETRLIISLLYRNYWCNGKQRDEYDERTRQNEIKFQRELEEKYQVADLFGGQEKTEEFEKEEGSIQPNGLMVYQEPLLKRIWFKIKTFFQKS